MILSTNRHLKRIFLLACALLMLALPVVNVIANSDCNNPASQMQQQVAINAETGMTPDVGLPQAGLSGWGAKALKPDEFVARAISSSHETNKAIAGLKQDVSILDFRLALQNNQIQFHEANFCAPVSCRAPPVFSAF